MDDGQFDLVGGSTIVGPDGKIIVESQTEEDEVIVADCDLDLCSPGKRRTFDFARHRRTENYGILTSQTGVVEPPFLSTPEGTRSPEPKKAHVGIPLSDQSKMGRSDSKPIRVLLCNPNATEAMTDACVEMVRPTLPPDVIVHGFTAPKPSPSAIEGNLDNILSAAVAARAIIPIADEYDAFLVACYSDHALTKVLREELMQPVVGIMEASLYAARMIGGRFGIIATSERTRFTLEDSVKNYGLTNFCIGVRAWDIGVLELDSKPEKDVQEIMCRVGKSLVEDGADVLTLGCAGMINMKTVVEEAVGQDVQVIDGVLAGVQHLVGLCRMGAKTAKRGMFASAARERESRAQNWL
jgi:Asp/Glu/hydantoin racemase